MVAGFSWASPSEPPLTLRATAFAKSSAARAAEGLLANQVRLRVTVGVRTREPYTVGVLG